MLLTLNALALLMLSGMSDLLVTTRLELAGVVIVNLLFAAGPSALTGRAARLGAAASLTGYLIAIVSWIVLAFGCGIEYFNPRCDAVVLPVIRISIILGLASLLVGRTIDWIVRAVLDRH
jgi:hypothetical protein